MTKEEKIVAELKKGNKNAFRYLYDLNVTKLYRFLRQFSTDHDQVEEWVQNSFIKAYEKIWQFSGNSSFGTWLFRIAINEMKTDMRRMGKYEYITPEAGAEELTASSETDFEWREEMKVILDGIDPAKKTIFILYEVEGYSHSEIADMLDISYAASRTILSRVRGKLKQRYMKLAEAQ